MVCIMGMFTSPSLVTIYQSNSRDRRTLKSCIRASSHKGKGHTVKKSAKQIALEKQMQIDREKMQEINRSFENELKRLSRYRALVLDSAYQPVEVINWQRAICMDIVGKVDVLEYYDITVNSSSDEFYLPAVVRVRIYIQKFKQCGPPITRKNILIRDRHMCQYCGSQDNLSIDHLIPVSKGGSWAWNNLVTACQVCNNKKGDKTLEQLGWKLKKIPKTPSLSDGAFVSGRTISRDCQPPEEWQNYLSPYMEFVVDINDAPEQYA
eukprot:TRINITY_DN3333_c0_g1_i1.p1 TRINITY_DN3333_c0_g1~~TRINITY_DN3333_c0_g1_i1.p1  ORF type:complete len:265 (+),score=4.12 TRINITY_DN3333_c0_g1_i1:429-1223(+)